MKTQNKTSKTARQENNSSSLSVISKQKNREQKKINKSANLSISLSNTQQEKERGELGTGNQTINNLENKSPVLSSCPTQQEPIAQAQDTYCLNNKSIIPTIQECERFIGFLNTKFSLNLPNNLLINIHKTNKNTMGYFTPEQNPEHYKQTDTNTALNSITLSSYFLNTNPYDTLTHELTHFINNNLHIKDCSSNQYHNKKFKAQAEKLLLKVSKGKKGYSQTEPTEEFNKMLEEYKPNYEVFKILQEIDSKEKKGSRLYLFTCSNECYKVRCGDRELKAVCGCGEPFIQVE